MIEIAETGNGRQAEDMVRENNKTLKDALDDHGQAVSYIVEAVNSIEAAVRTSGRDPGKGGGEAAPRSRAVSLLKFLEGMIIFETAIIAALFIGGPRHGIDGWPQANWFGDSQYILGWTLDWLVFSVVVATLAAFLTQFSQERINAGSLWRFIPITLAFLAGGFGFTAAYPYWWNAFSQLVGWIFG